MSQLPHNVLAALKHGISNNKTTSVVMYHAHSQLIFPCIKCNEVLALAQPNEWKSLREFFMMHHVVKTSCVHCSQPLVVLHSKVFDAQFWEGSTLFEPPTLKSAHNIDDILMDQIKNINPDNDRT